ncbi:MAG TPA: RsmB/NOP family class I SAM-dependent RNA methyltransferase [Xanthobacteraceae bacterium]|nr:RsmB/NOP family class I SAM-dependent RNA methyltransferase [Xanthobacteraceae bacterium]
MTPGARLTAAIEVLTDIEGRRRPAADALKDWGLAHRFAGSGDRAAIGGLVFDALRRRSSAAYLMGASTPRAILLGALRLERGMSLDAIARLADGARYAPAPPDDVEAKALAAPPPQDAPAHVRGDYPEWLDPYFATVFGEERAEEGAALSSRAPVDLRVNTLKSDREAVLAALAHLHARRTPWSVAGLRIALSAEAKSPPLYAEPAYIDGLFEIQDEGSQLAALLSAARPGETVVDLCAGGGGKTLALAALMRNSGRICATDTDIRRLAPIHGRIERAGVQNVEVRTPRGEAELLDDLVGAADLVLIDAPCTGVGAWRRNPDAKWRVRPGALEQRIKAQDSLLARSARLVKPGGRIAYITCSLLEEENGARVRAFVGRHPEFAVVPADDVVDVLGAAKAQFRAAVMVSAEGLLMTPRRTGTDGFFVAVLRRG